MHGISLAIVLYAFWLALSGHFTPFLLAMGAASVLFCLAAAHRMGALDGEGHPVHLLPAFVTYLPWLIWEIIKSGWAVTKIILSPSLPVSPTMTRVRASQKSPVGVNVYANSITLTPGTITMAVKGGDTLIVHALVREGADDLQAGGMDARVTRFEGTA